MLALRSYFFYYVKLQIGGVVRHYLTSYPAESCLLAANGKRNSIAKVKKLMRHLIQKWIIFDVEYGFSTILENRKTAAR
jgi:hypothetical protein